MLDKKVKSAIEELSDGNFTREKILNIFQGLCLEFCIDQFAIAMFTGKRNIAESFWIHATYSKEWMQRYKDKQYHLYDPVFSSLQKVAIPFEWDTKSFQNIDSLQSSLMKEAHDFGVCSGLTIPLIPHKTFHGFVTILNKPSLHHDALYALSLAGNICANKIIYLKNKEN